MLSITGKVLKKERKTKNNNAEIVLMDDFQNPHSFQVRPNRIHKLIEIDTNNRVQVFYKTELAERHNKDTGDTNRVTYLILEDIELTDLQ